jgi:hypothetical protein
MKLGLDIQKNFGHYNKIPVCNTIKKILVGKLISFHWSYRHPLVILAVRRNNLYGHLEMLVGEYNGYSVGVSSWYAYQRSNMMFVGRDNKKAIRNCLKRNPKYINYHLGKSVDLSKTVLYINPPLNYTQGTIVIYDNCNYYRDYIESS